MKKIFFILTLSVLLFSCKTSNQVVFNTPHSNNVGYNYNMVLKNQSEDAKYIRENWTQEQKDDFVRRYVYKTVIFDGDTLK